jgi:hypothetical protein
MATQQHPAFDPNQQLPGVEAPRIAGIRKDYCGSGAQDGGGIEDSQLRAAAEAEARTWTEQEPDGKVAAMEAKWKATKAAIEEKLTELRAAINNGQTLTGDAEIFIASSSGLRSSLQQTKEMFKKVGEPMWRWRAI